MENSLEHLQAGDKIAVRAEGGIASYIPSVDFIIYEVARKTATQIVTTNGTRFLSKNGRPVGGSLFKCCIQATPEMLAKHEQQLAIRARYRKAAAAIDDLINRPLNRLKLSMDQIERLAEVWSEVKSSLGVTAKSESPKGGD